MHVTGTEMAERQRERTLILHKRPSDANGSPGTRPTTPTGRPLLTGEEVLLRRPRHSEEGGLQRAKILPPPLVLSYPPASRSTRKARL